MSKFIIYASILVSVVLGLQIGAYYMRDITVIYCNENPTICQQEYKITKSKYPDISITAEQLIP